MGGKMGGEGEEERGKRRGGRGEGEEERGERRGGRGEGEEERGKRRGGRGEGEEERGEGGEGEGGGEQEEEEGGERKKGREGGGNSCVTCGPKSQMSYQHFFWSDNKCAYCSESQGCKDVYLAQHKVANTGRGMPKVGVVSMSYHLFPLFAHLPCSLADFMLNCVRDTEVGRWRRGS